MEHLAYQAVEVMGFAALNPSYARGRSRWMEATPHADDEGRATPGPRGRLMAHGARRVAAQAERQRLKERTMPHVIVKLYHGRSEQKKSRLAAEIVKDVIAIANCGEESVSVAIEEIKAEDWP